MKYNRQKRGFYSIPLTAALLVPLSLSACSSNASPPPEASPTPAVSATPAPTSAPAPTASPSETAPAPSTTPDGTGNTESKASSELKSILALARKGEVKGSEFAAHIDLFDEVERKWGKPDKQESAGKGMYATYSKEKITFGFNKGMKIFDVRSYAASLNQYNVTAVKQALGEPADTTVNGEDTIYTYPAGDFQLKVVIPKSTGLVDHISVYSPQDAKNNMAG
ncbi:YjgB family protein [Paenibacillus sp. FJAT-26967]|uniref:YjgB family protein n=1 Tax=Paenibacillus sp. FJAT-26967 TaxID=1729690 RepID=UPI0008382B3D|nr:YjgB family protein [Paenibacillus sp. FJAT-26967]